MTAFNATSDALLVDCWYVASTAEAIGHALVSARAADRPLVLFRRTSGEVVALEDRCAHRAYPLSAGVLDGDTIRCGLCGFTYDTDGRCISVPTQPHVPFGADVTAYPVTESDGLVWVWLGERGRARLHRVPQLPWLDDDAWASVGGERLVDAGLLLLHENFADVTQVPFVAPDLAPSALNSTPPLDVVVTETTVSLHREYPAAPLPDWQARLLDGTTAPHTTVHEGQFLSPAVWVDHWDATADGSVARLRFTQLVTPVTPRQSRVVWRVCRDFATQRAGTDQELTALFADYYERVFSAMETLQRVVDVDGPSPEVNVAADVAALKVRDIVTAMLSEERPSDLPTVRRVQA